MKGGISVLVIPLNLSGIWMCERHGTKDYVGYWQVPGGTQETGEEDIDTAIRELREETGITASRAELKQIYSGTFTKPNGEIFRAVQFAMLSEAIPQNLEPDKHGTWRIVPWRAIKALRTFDAIQEIVRDMEAG